ncbi:MAG: insulinase family protein [Agitococcus sp.]|nr:insulinase family protein [Agitococcus sp.]
MKSVQKLVAAAGVAFLLGQSLGFAKEPQHPSPRLTRTQTQEHDLVTIEHPDSDVAVVLLSLPRTKRDYSPREYESAAIAVKAVASRLDTVLTRYGSSVAYINENGTPTISVTLLAEHLPTVLPLVTHHWFHTRFNPQEWQALLTQEATGSSAPDPLDQAVAAVLAQRSGLPVSSLKYDPRQFDRSRTALIVSGPLSTKDTLQILGDNSPLRRTVTPPHRIPRYLKPSVSECEFAATDTSLTVILLPLDVNAVSESAWPSARITIAVAGTGFESRLNQELRTKKGWAYGAGIPMYYYPSYSIGVAKARVTAEKALASAQLMKAVLSSLTTSPASDIEIRLAKEFLVENYWTNRELVTHEAAYLADFLNAGMSIKQFEGYADSLTAVSSAQVKEFAIAHPVSIWVDKAYAVKANGSLCRLPLV